MGSKITQKTYKLFCYEIVERIIRFLLHLEEIKSQFYQDNKQNYNQNDLISSYKEVLLKLLKMSIQTAKECKECKKDLIEYFNIQKEIFNSVNELHVKWLSILPRPKEPVELIRFQRVIQKQVLLFDKTKKEEDFTISVNEKLGEEIYKNPLSKFIDETLSNVIKNYNQKCTLKVDSPKSESPSHITIPRLDANNTLRWPSLLHEMSHKLLNSEIFHKDNIFKEFCNTFDIDESNIENNFYVEFSSIFQPEEIKDSLPEFIESWLVECWCDLFA